MPLFGRSAPETRRQLQDELLYKWSESFETTKVSTIPIDQLKGYLDHLQDAFGHQGIDQEFRKKMDAGLYEKKWKHLRFEFSSDKCDQSGAWNGMIAFKRSPDDTFVDCMIVLYKMDFQLAPNIIETKKRRFVWTWMSQPHEDPSVGSQSIKEMQNNVRTKVLRFFSEEGFIDEINKVVSIYDDHMCTMS